MYSPRLSLLKYLFFVVFHKYLGARGVGRDGVGLHLIL